MIIRRVDAGWRIVAVVVSVALLAIGVATTLAFSANEGPTSPYGADLSTVAQYGRGLGLAVLVVGAIFLVATVGISIKPSRRR